MSSYEAYLDLIRRLDGLVAGLELHPDFATREQAVSLLTGLDALHRAGLTRLVERLREAGAGAALEQATNDPIVATLLGLYDLADLGLPDEPPPAPPPAFIPLARLGRRVPPRQ